MSEAIYEHAHPIILDGTTYRAYVHGAARPDGTWTGWIEFVSGTTRLRTDQETSQSNRDALAYWARGLEDVYFDGALRRAR
ncbi:MAG TPA: hypothetical protein VNI54_16965 [Thermoanaerobaculia bacterium]|nr:hypothetical protein [Thermoanaerobaculia bacterium]